MGFINLKDEAVLLLIDFQEKLMPGMKDKEALEDKTVRLIKGCRALKVPMLVSEQYPRGLGATIPSIKEAVGEETCIVEKTAFSCCGQEGFLEALAEFDRQVIIVAGIESHICVQQTVDDLLEEDYEVFVIADAVSSRNGDDKEYALRRMYDVGATITTYESILFELLGDAKEPEFKEISSIVR